MHGNRLGGRGPTYNVGRTEVAEPAKTFYNKQVINKKNAHKIHLPCESGALRQLNGRIQKGLAY